jgi:hypothetical protein
MIVTVILANLMSSSGTPNDETISRIKKAVELEAYSPSSMLILCGWAYRQDSEITIADSMYSYIEENHHELRNKSRCQRLSRDTVGDAIFTRLYLSQYEQAGRLRLRVVTSEYHLARTSEIFRFVFGADCTIECVGAVARAARGASANEADSIAAFRKTFLNVTPGDINAQYVKLRFNHPYYNGQVFPKIVSMETAVRLLAKAD